MFEVYEKHEEEAHSYTVYAVDMQPEGTYFLLWDEDERQWFWDNMEHYVPIIQKTRP